MFEVTLNYLNEQKEFYLLKTCEAGPIPDLLVTLNSAEATEEEDNVIFKDGNATNGIVLSDKAILRKRVYFSLEMGN